MASAEQFVPHNEIGIVNLQHLAPAVIQMVVLLLLSPKLIIYGDLLAHRREGVRGSVLTFSTTFSSSIFMFNEDNHHGILDLMVERHWRIMQSCSLQLSPRNAVSNPG